MNLLYWCYNYTILCLTTLFLLCLPVLEKYLPKYIAFKFWSRFKPIIDSYSGPMKDGYWYWPGILLGTRVPILSIVTFFAIDHSSYYPLTQLHILVVSTEKDCTALLNFGS